jgi:RimJ/RimL family protein N-acetyltransferase
MSMVEVDLRPWTEHDLPLLQQLLGDPDMMAHLGGPETPEQIEKRHQRYLHLPETDHMFVILWGPSSLVAGSIGYWEKNWRDELVYEMGWFVSPAFQGQGVATKAGEATLEHARHEHRHQFMHAFPAVDNPASNAICRKLGFTLVEEGQFEYPPGHTLTVNDWRFDLFAK